MNERDICEANRKSWNETAAVHQRAALSDLLEAVRSPNFCTFDAVERRVFESIDLVGKSVVQLACNNARELISIKRAGAADCFGFDISDAFVEQAHRLAAVAQLDIQVVRSSIYDIPPEYSNRFELAYITVGALGWLPNLPRLFSKVADLLRPGGQLFIYEMHPFLFIYDEETADPCDPRISRSYFRDDPVVFSDCSDYLDPQTTIDSPGYWHQHTLGQIMSNLLGAGFALESFEEFPHDISATHAEFAKQPNKLPMCYSLVARKGTD
jgi:SAM-dependent methyltransferase